MSATRALLESSFHAALRTSQGALSENAATLAGHYLQIAGGDAERAHALLGTIDTHDSITARKLFETARVHLAKVVEEERAERGPKLKTGSRC